MTHELRRQVAATEMLMALMLDEAAKVAIDGRDSGPAAARAGQLHGERLHQKLVGLQLFEKETGKLHKPTQLQQLPVLHDLVQHGPPYRT
jgi:hypothetical protein